MRKSIVFLAVLLTVLLVGSVWAQKARYEIAPKYPTNFGRQQANDPWAAGSYLNPYQIKDKSTGQNWTVRPKYPDFGDRSGAFAPGSYLNPMVIEEK
jgi:hypothetical protein